MEHVVNNTMSFHVRASRAKSTKLLNFKDINESEGSKSISSLGKKEKSARNGDVKRKKTVFKVGTEDQLKEIFNAGRAEERKKKFDKSTLEKQCIRLQKYLKLNIKYFIKRDEDDEEKGIDELGVDTGPKSVPYSPKKNPDLVPVSRKAESNDVEPVRAFFRNNLKHNAHHPQVIFNNKHQNNDNEEHPSILINVPSNLEDNELENEVKDNFNSSLMDNSTAILVKGIDESLIVDNKLQNECKNNSLITITKKAKPSNNSGKGKKTVSFLFSSAGERKSSGEKELIRFKARDYMDALNTQSLFKNSEYKDEDFQEIPEEENEEIKKKKSSSSTYIPRIKNFTENKLKGIKETVLAQISGKKKKNSSSAKTLPVRLKFSEANVNEILPSVNTNKEHHDLINLNNIKESSHTTSSSDNESEKQRKEEQKNEKEQKRVLRKMSRVISDSLSIEEEIFELDDEEDSGWLIMPDSTFKIVWDSIMGILTIFSLLYTPIVIAFGETKTLTMLIFEMIIDLFYISDVIFNFFIPFHNFEENLIKSYKLIAINYFKTWFIWDFIACLPLGTVVGFIELSLDERTFGKSFLSLNQAARLAKFYRILKISQLFRIIRMANKNEFKKMAKIHFLDDLNVSSGIKRFINFVLGYLLVTHVLSCIWIFLGGVEGGENWIASAGLSDYPHVELYLASVYFIWTTVFTIGYGDITPQTTYERTFVILLMFIGVLVYSFAVSSLGTILTSYDVMTEKYMKSLQMLNEIKLKHKVDDNFYDKVARYLNYHFKSKPVEQFTFINELPPALKNTMLKKMYNDVIKYFKFLKFDNEDFRSKVVLSLRPVRAFKKEYIIVENEYIEEFVLVRRGALSVNLSYKYKEAKVMEVRKNEHFGDILMMAQQKSPVNVKVISKVADLFYISKNDLVDISLQFPEIFDRIYLISTYNYLIMLELMEEKIEKIEREEQRFEAMQMRENSKKAKKGYSLVSNSTLNTKNQNKNYLLVNSFKRVNKDDIENARKEVQKIYEMKNNFAGTNFFRDTINEKLCKLTLNENQQGKQLDKLESIKENEKSNGEIESSKRDDKQISLNKNKAPGHLVHSDKMTQNILKLSNLNKDKKKQHNSVDIKDVIKSNELPLQNSENSPNKKTNANNKISEFILSESETARYLNQHRVSDNVVIDKRPVNLVNLNLYIQNNNFITNNPPNDQPIVNQNQNTNEKSEEKTSSYKIDNNLSNINSDSMISGGEGVKGKFESHNNFTKHIIPNIDTHIEDNKLFSKTLIYLKKPKLSSNKILRRMNGRYKKLFNRFQKLKKIKSKRNSFEVKIDSKDTFLNLIEDNSPRKKREMNAKSQGVKRDSVKFNNQKTASPFRNQVKNVQKRHHLSEILVSSIGQKVRSFVQEQKNPEKFFKNELKSIIDNYFERETIDQLIRVGEIFYTHSQKYRIEDEFHKMFVDLFN